MIDFNEEISDGRIKRPGHVKVEARTADDSVQRPAKDVANDTLTDFVQTDTGHLEPAAALVKPARVIDDEEAEETGSEDRNASEILRGRDEEVLRYLRAGTARRQTAQVDKEKTADSAAEVQQSRASDTDTGQETVQ